MKSWIAFNILPAQLCNFARLFFNVMLRTELRVEITCWHSIQASSATSHHRTSWNRLKLLRGFKVFHNSPKLQNQNASLRPFSDGNETFKRDMKIDLEKSLKRKWRNIYCVVGKIFLLQYFFFVLELIINGAISMHEAEKFYNKVPLECGK